MAPTSKVFACSQTGLEKSGANSTIRGSSSAGSVGIRKTPFGEDVFLSLCGLPLLFQRSKLDKVELSGCAGLRLRRRCRFSIYGRSSHEILDCDFGSDLKVAGHLGRTVAHDLPSLTALLDNDRVTGQFEHWAGHLIGFWGANHSRGGE